jgi:hypothetical protein
MTIEKLSKLDAACRQLDTAIELWFRESDPVSIHTLACSAHQIIHDTIHHRGGQDPLFDSPYIKKESRKRAKELLHKSYSFFKHANRDPETSIEFDASAPEIFILVSLDGLEQLGVERNLLRLAFLLYFGFLNPDLFAEPFFQRFHIDVLRKLNLSRAAFLEKLRQASNLDRYLTP